jgi:hypothetical protein
MPNVINVLLNVLKINIHSHSLNPEFLPQFMTTCVAHQQPSYVDGRTIQLYAVQLCSLVAENVDRGGRGAQ